LEGSNWFCLEEKIGKEIKYQEYDILNDICVKYAKEFFGEDQCPNCGGFGIMAMDNPCEFCKGGGSISFSILAMTQQNKPQEEIEKYIWDNCKFNPKNK